MAQNKIAELRKEQSITLQQLADYLGVSNGTIGRYETGLRQPKSETWKSLADYFGVEVPYIQGFSSLPDGIKQTEELYHLQQSLPNGVKQYINSSVEFASLARLYEALQLAHEVKQVQNPTMRWVREHQDEFALAWITKSMEYEHSEKQ